MYLRSRATRCRCSSSRSRPPAWAPIPSASTAAAAAWKTSRTSCAAATASWCSSRTGTTRVAREQRRAPVLCGAVVPAQHYRLAAGARRRGWTRAGGRHEFAYRDWTDVGQTLQGSRQGNYQVVRDRSSVYQPYTKGFPDNSGSTRRSRSSPTARRGSSSRILADGHAVTLHQHLSFVRLPDAGYRPAPSIRASASSASRSTTTGSPSRAVSISTGFRASGWNAPIRTIPTVPSRIRSCITSTRAFRSRCAPHP